MIVARGRIDCATGPNKSLQVHVNVSLRLSSRHGATPRAVATLFALRTVRIDFHSYFVRTKSPDRIRITTRENLPKPPSGAHFASLPTRIQLNLALGANLPASVSLEVFFQVSVQLYIVSASLTITVPGFLWLLSKDVDMALGQR